jgi:hypothetical protein
MEVTFAEAIFNYHKFIKLTRPFPGLPEKNPSS